MTRSKNTTTATLAFVFVSGLAMSTASAAPHWSDISYVTHGAASDEPREQQFGRLPGDFYKWSDKGSFGTARVGIGVKPIGHPSGKPANWSDLTSVTHN